jgi:phosphatidate cytidylyltransferase
MPLNLQTLKTRSLTALIFVVVMLVGLFWNFWSFSLLFTLIHFGCWYEYVKLIKKIHGKKYLTYSFTGILYITIPLLLLLSLYLNYVVFTLIPQGKILPDERTIPCLIIFSIWINDTTAYIVGSLIGKTPFSKISPKKTWEGTIGGAILCVVVIGLTGNYIPAMQKVSMWYNSSSVWYIIAALCAIFGTLGDLFESKLKRMANVKDSGSFMPGHGGFLDRFDSLLFAVPAVWVYVKLFM